MAPINLPDGTEVSEVILPDGATASEVVAPDGSTVLSAIPDGQLDHRWPHSGGSELSDAVGSLSGSLNGSSFVSDADAVDDTILRHEPSNGDHVSFGQGAFDFVANGDLTATGYVYLNSASSIQAIMGQDSGGGQFAIFVTGSAELRAQLGANLTFSSLTFNTGQWHFWAVRLDTANDQVLGRIDDTTATISTTSTADAASSTDARIAHNGNRVDLDGDTDETTLTAGLLSDADLDTLKARRDDFN